MKYERLSKEQLEELHQEFIRFLATQSITAKEWADIKEKQPQVAEEELDIFSDLVWEGVLKTTQYIDHVSERQLNLFYTGNDQMKLISVRVQSMDLRTAEGLSWLQEHITEDEVELFTATKKYGEDPNIDKFNIIKQGGTVSKGEWYKMLEQIINS